MTEYNGVERSTTEHLRQLLDKRGVKWDKGAFPNEARTYWQDMVARPWDTQRLYVHALLTPEQAVAATLGRGTCKFEYTLADNGWADHTCSECGYVENLDVHVGLGWHYCPNCGREIVE